MSLKDIKVNTVELKTMQNLQFTESNIMDNIENKVKEKRI